MGKPSVWLQFSSPNMAISMVSTSLEVKFVPKSTSLTEVLRQSRGNVMAWLSQQKPKALSVDQAL